ncbi:MAG: hypothetical protein ABIE74_12925 [Pseudomonadota bacterium]
MMKIFKPIIDSMLSCYGKLYFPSAGKNPIELGQASSFSIKSRNLYHQIARLPVKLLSSNEILREYDAIRLSDEEIWIDSGSGIGTSLTEIGKRNDRGEVIGYDLDQIYYFLRELGEVDKLQQIALSENSRYYIFGQIPLLRLKTPLIYRHIQSLPESSVQTDIACEELNRALIEEFGLQSAHVFSILYPDPFGPQISPRLSKRRILHYQIDAAFNLLCKGGIGIIVSDNKRCFNSAILRLKNELKTKIAAIRYSPSILSNNQLLSVGIHPYNKPGKVAFNGAYMAIFQTI